MNESASGAEERVRAAEVIAACCLATDLSMGFPFEHGLHATLMTMRLVHLLGVDPETASQTYYVSLLTFKFLHSVSSAQIHGVGRDAARIAGMIVDRRATRREAGRYAVSRSASVGDR